jgi:hypothetical protein
MSDSLEQVISSSISDISDAGGDGGEAVDTADSGDAPASDLGSGEAVQVEAPEGAAVASGDGTTPVTQNAVTEQPTLNAELPADSDDLLKTEFKGNKNNRVPYNRVKAIVENARRKEAEVHQTKIREYEQRHAAHANDMQALRVADENPEHFLSVLAQADPRYAKLLARVFESPQGQPTGAASGVDTGKPEPDLQFPDGTLQYSAEATERLADWKADQRVKELERRYEKRFGPMEQDFRVTQIRNAVVPKVQAQIAQAKQWPGFTENQEAISAVLARDRGISLEGAYMKVVLPKMQANRDEMRRSLLAEQRQRSQAASTVVASGAPASSGAAHFDGQDAVESAIRESIAGLKG